MAFISALALGVLALAPRAAAADFSVMTPGGAFAFTINGVGGNPTITLVRGKTYTFAVNTSTFPDHPFDIVSSTGVTNNSINSGTVTFAVPYDDTNYSYICPVHFFSGTIVTIPPPPAPHIKIVGFTVGTNLVVTSTGTNTWGLHPEYSTNLTDTNWYALTVVTNLYRTGTNETICGKPDGTPVFIRIRAH